MNIPLSRPERSIKMNYLQQSFAVTFSYKVYFTSNLFSTENVLLKNFFEENAQPGSNKKILFVVDKGVADFHPNLVNDIRQYFGNLPSPKLATEILMITGGEGAKNDETLLNTIVDAVNQHGIDRHSYLAAIGGGSVLDLAGFGAAIAHRGIKHIRIATTVLSQNDSGVGVKNGINYKGKKNFIGTFAPPVAVFNDDQFLKTLSDRDWRSGISEAVKVALIKDAAFFNWVEENAAGLASRNLQVMNYLVKRCAELHLQHIRSGDPFETGSARPLDFGHWSAHKLEQLTNFSVLHGEAVAMGIALDTVYSGLLGYLAEPDVQRIIHLFIKLGFSITHPYMQLQQADSPVLAGLEEFREHLGGQLTITLLTAIGTGIEVHEMDHSLLRTAAKKVEQFASPAMDSI